MDARRQTLVSNGPLGNSHAGSSLPVPQSAMKKPATRIPSNRFSLAPGTGAGGMGTTAPQSRMSMMPGTAHGSAVIGRTMNQDNMGRRSIMSYRGNGDYGMSSGNRGDGGVYGKTPARAPPQSVRRSSVFPRQSMAPSSGMGPVIKDTRPIRNQQFQQACQQNVHDFLAQSRAQFPMTAKTFTSPTQREFQLIFVHLIKVLFDGDYAFKQFDTDCLALLKDLRYPGVDNCGKTAMVAPGTPQHWPHLIAMLNWLVDLCKAHETWSEVYHDDPLEDLQNEIPADYSNLEERVFWAHSSKTYKVWFDQGTDMFPVAEAELKEFYDRLAQSTFEESEELETELQRLQADLRQLQVEETKTDQKPPLRALSDDYTHLMADKSKFIHYNEQLGLKRERMQNIIDRVKLSNIEHDKLLEQLHAELATIETQVAAQNLSPDEVNRMNHERESLTKQLHDLRSKIAEATQYAFDQELSVTKSMDRFDQHLTDYTSFAHQIGTMTPSEGPFMGPGGVDYSIDLELGLGDVNEIQASGRKMREIIRPALNKYDEDIRIQTRVVGEEQAGLDGELDKLGMTVEQQKADASNKNLELRKKLTEAEAARASHAQEASDLQNQVNKLEESVTTMSSAVQEGYQATVAAIETLTVKYLETKHAIDLLQDHVTNQITAHLDIIVKAKTHTSATLKGIRQYAETQS